MIKYYVNKIATEIDQYILYTDNLTDLMNVNMLSLCLIAEVDHITQNKNKKTHKIIQINTLSGQFG